MYRKAELQIPVSSGLDLAHPPSSIPPGKLIQAKNKAPGVWGPRFGKSFVDRESRGRAHAQLNGSSSYLTIPYNSVQLGFGVSFTLSMLWKITSLPGTGEDAHFLGADDSSRGGIDCYVDDSGVIIAKLYDGSSTVTLTSVESVAANDIVNITIIRDRGDCYLVITNASDAVGPVQEAVGTGLSSTAGLEDNSKDYILGKRPAYHTGSGTGYLNAIFGGMYIRSGRQTNYEHAFSELPNPRSSDVIAAWTGELIDSDAAVYDASRTRVDMLATSVSQASRIAELIEPVQGMGYYSFMDGRLRNFVMLGGRLFSETF